MNWVDGFKTKPDKEGYYLCIVMRGFNGDVLYEYQLLYYNIHDNRTSYGPYWSESEYMDEPVDNIIVKYWTNITDIPVEVKMSWMG